MVAVAPAWRRLLPLTGLLLLVLLGAYWSTAVSLVAIWYRSETFAHGFVIAPISLWLIWRIRNRLLALAPQPGSIGLLLLLGFSLLWVLAQLAEVSVVAQFALVAMLPATVWALLGNRVTAAMAFPLLYLLLMVPAGEVLLLPLMNFTADFTVAALRLTGIPVYREGLWFMIPSGSWSVVEACSGLRYLIASGTLGLLYAYLTYQSFTKRAVFIIASLLVPILANGIRAYIIVMLGHLSGMKLAVGVDHLIYGWVFFGIVMLALFWGGSYWRDPDPLPDGAETASTLPAYPLPWIVWPVLALLAGPVLFWGLSQPYRGPAPALQLKAVPQWSLTQAAPDDPRPDFGRPAAQARQGWRNGEGRVGTYVALFAGAAGESRLVSSGNRLFDTGSPAWQLLEQSIADSPVGQVRQSVVRGPTGKWLLQQCYLIDGERVVSDYRAKWLQLRSRLLGSHGAGAALVVYVPYDEVGHSVRQIDLFWREQYPSLAAAVSASLPGLSR